MLNLMKKLQGHKTNLIAYAMILGAAMEILNLAKDTYQIDGRTYGFIILVFGIVVRVVSGITKRVKE